MPSLADRVKARHIEAKEWESEKARKTYLKEHPLADPKRHTLLKKVKEKVKKKVEEDIKALHEVSKAARSTLAKAPQGAKTFFQDPKARKEGLMAAQGALKKGTQTYAKKLIATAKHEAEEFKTAGGAIKDVLKGKRPMSPEQKKAVRTVAIHMGITAAAAAFSTAGVMAGAAFFAKATAKHIAIKAAKASLGDIYVLSKFGTVGKGIFGLMDKFSSDKRWEEDFRVAADGGETNPEEALAALVMAKVSAELENLNEEDLATILEEMAASEEGQKKEARGPSTPDELRPLVDRAETIHKHLRGWIRKFPSVLRQAEREVEGLDPGLVWQDRFVEYWKETDSHRDRLFGLYDEVYSVYTFADTGKLQGAANDVLDTVGDPTDRKARVEHAFSKPEFHDHPTGRRDHIAYEVKLLKEWAKHHESWIDKSLQALRKVERKL